MGPRECVELACVLEATARKPGNVSVSTSFEDLTYVDMVAAAIAIGPIVAEATGTTIGETILKAVQASQAAGVGNANLGIILLLTPLVAGTRSEFGAAGVSVALDRLTVKDAELAYQAIRLANPGGLGTASEQDVADRPTVTLLEAMRLAADRDMVARQYASGFADVIELGAPALTEGLARAGTIEDAIVWCQLSWLAARPDSLIARKRGRDEAEEASRLAKAILEELPSKPGPGLADRPAIRALDAWLRGEDHDRNPGTTADLVTASLFWALRGGKIKLAHATFRAPFDPEAARE